MTEIDKLHVRKIIVCSSHSQALMVNWTQFLILKVYFKRCINSLIFRKNTYQAKIDTRVSGLVIAPWISCKTTLSNNGIWS